MKTCNQRILAALGPLAAMALVLGACGGEKQVQAQSPAAVAPPPTTAAVPNTPTASNVSISDDLLRACNIPEGDAYFPFDSSHVTSTDHGTLDKVAKCFTTGPMAGRHLRLVGHADPRGEDEYNTTLGQSRADAVAKYLSSQGLSRDSESTSSRGALDATGTDETGWAHDRRVDVQLAN